MILREGVSRLMIPGLVALSMAAPAAAQVDILTQHNDRQRTGANLKETRLNATNVKAGFGKLCYRILDGNVYAQPLFASGVVIDGTPRDVVIVATENNTVYAFDADDTNQASTKFTLWKSAQLGTPVPSEELSFALQNDPGGCTNLTTQIGITSTPVISPDKKTIYVVAKTLAKAGDKAIDREGEVPRPELTAQFLHALNLSDGKPAGKPVEIKAEVPGAGVGSRPGKDGKPTIKFDSDHHLNRAALLLLDGVLYVGFGGHCDTPPYHGWLFAYDAATLKMLDVFNTTPNDIRQFNPGEGAIWQSGQGPAADELGNIYISTGNGSYNATKGGLTNDYGDSVVKLKLDAGKKFQVEDWFTPSNQALLNIDDADLGSTGPMMVPDSHLLIAAGKEGKMYLLDRDNLGYGLAPPLHAMQVTYGPLKFPGFPRTYWNLHVGPVAWRQADRTSLYFWGEEDKLKQYTLVRDDSSAGWKFASDLPYASQMTAAMPKPPLGDGSSSSRGGKVFMPGGILSLSADGEKEGTGIIWSSMPIAEDAVNQVVRGVLRAFDASDVRGNELWNSEANPADSVGIFAKFCPPTVADGKVFLPALAEEIIDPNNNIHRVKPPGQGGLQPALAIYGLR